MMLRLTEWNEKASEQSGLTVFYARPIRFNPLLADAEKVKELLKKEIYYLARKKYAEGQSLGTKELTELIDKVFSEEKKNEKDL